MQNVKSKAQNLTHRYVFDILPVKPKNLLIEMETLAWVEKIYYLCTLIILLIQN